VSPEHIELSRRLVACKHFRWMPGMAFFIEYDTQDRVVSESDTEFIKNEICSDFCLDFSDPATLGCLLALVRKAWDDERISVAFAKAEGRLVIIESHCNAMLAHGRYFYGDTECEALIAALEAAP
jgi:hypothetical protein